MRYIIFFSLLLNLAWAKTYESEGQKFNLENLVSRDEVIWGFDFLPDEKIIFTERSGKMFLFDMKTKKTAELSGIPTVYAQGQGGLLDVTADPKFKENKRIFFTYSEPAKDGKSTTAVGVGILEGEKFFEVKRIFSADYPVDDDNHYGSRIEFDKTGNLFVTIGERRQREDVWNLNNHFGKLIRITPEGKPAEGNPYLGVKNVKPEIYAYGLRSPQGLAIHPETGELWEGEMGPRGGDEVNVIDPKKNYGWSKVTKGREYYGPRIGKEKMDGVEEPVVFWTPSISPSGMDFYSGDKFPKWKGNLFLGCLSGEHLRRVVLDGRKVIKQEKLLEDLDARFRAVRQGPDGFLYFSTDDGKITRIKNL